MAETKQTIGQAIDTIIETFSALADDKSREVVWAAVSSHLNLVPTPVSAPGIPLAPTGEIIPVLPARMPSVVTDIRTLKEEKQPATATQMACIVAYYLKEIAVAPEHKDTITSLDIDKYFKQASFKLPKNTKQLLVDSKQSGYFDSGAAAGQYKLNAVGHNLVAHSLPKNKK